MSWKERDVHCESCQAPGKLVDWEYSETYVCNSCGTVHKIAGVVFRKVGTIEPKSSDLPVLPLNSIFSWEDVDYKIAGFSVKKDHENYRWHEYVAISKTGQYIHISYFNGHWNVMEVYTDVLKARVEKEMQRKKDFALWNKYSVKTVKMSGCYPYDVMEWLNYNSVETVSAPYILTGEKSKSGMVTYLGTYVEPKQIQKKTSEKFFLPSRMGIVGNQPFYKAFEPIHWWIVTACVTLLLFVFNAFFNGISDKHVAINTGFEISDSSMNKPITTQSFTINKYVVPIKFVSYSTVSNNWAELGIDLVDEKSNKSRSFSMGMEYYSGTSDGYSWAEGNMSKTEYLCSVPAGTYHLVITPNKGKSQAPVRTTLLVTVDPDYTNDVLILAGILIGLSIIASVWKYFFESSRWNSSPFSYIHNN